MIFVTDMDVDDVSYRKVVEQLTELYGKKIAPLHFPIREDGKICRICKCCKTGRT